MAPRLPLALAALALLVWAVTAQDGELPRVKSVEGAGGGTAAALAALATGAGGSDAEETAAIPESLPRKFRRATPASGAGGVPVARVLRHTADQARDARLAARPGDIHVSGGPPPDSSTQSICGANSLVATNYPDDCHIVSTWTSYGSYYCSAFRFGPRHLGTAGHCVYDSGRGGFAKYIDVYCSGSYACGSRTTWATDMVVTPSWVAASGGSTISPWDMAAIKVAKRSSTWLKIGQYGPALTRRIELTGYPSQNPESTACNSASYAGACYQHSSKDTLSSMTSGPYYSDTADTCGGVSGASVWDRDVGYVTAVVASHDISRCRNYFTPQINKAHVVASSCERARGGVSLMCLAGEIP